jgi:uncharacterized protein
MQIKLSKKPKKVTIVEGFPGFGLVGTITTGFLVDHLKCEQIGKHYFEDPPVTLAVHGCKLVDPIGVFYNKKYNLVIVHSIAHAVGMEWKAAEVLLDIAEQLEAKEIITIEGVGSTETTESRAFHYCTNATARKKLSDLGYTCLGEGIIVGVTSALLLKSKVPQTCLFAETHSQLPDSKAAAKIIELLDKYLDLAVDYKPLLKQAEVFEERLKTILEQSKKANDLKDKKNLSYLG